MKINQWTLGLAAVGVVSLASAVNAEEAKMNALQTALSSTTISGYVDTSVEWTLDRSDYIQGSIPFRSDKANGFNLNVVKLSLEKPMDESEWASGYKVDLLFGPDANYYNLSSSAHGDGDFSIKQAYVALRTPVGNGIDWKVGVFDTIIGYETYESGNNPNFTRSWGYYAEPTEHTGILATYRVNENIAVAAGVANTTYAGINNRSYNAAWHKAGMASIAVTAPKDCGFLAGSTLYAGAVIGPDSSDNQQNYYVGATLNTPVAGLKAGLSFDSVRNAYYNDGEDTWVVGVYASYQATEKLSLHGRAEYAQLSEYPNYDYNTMGLTGTVQYDLWKNVLSRLELRWDQDFEKSSVESYRYADTGLSLYANFIYKF
jgi:hypothetical protein